MTTAAASTLSFFYGYDELFSKLVHNATSRDE